LEESSGMISPGGNISKRELHMIKEELERKVTITRKLLGHVFSPQEHQVQSMHQLNPNLGVMNTTKGLYDNYYMQ
jgi:hypothetical protein